MTTPVYSKPIRTTDESSKQLIQELLSGSSINLSDIDSFYCINGTYHFIEFIQCANPNSFNCLKSEDIDHILITIHPIVQFVKQAKGVLYLTLYNDDKEVFALVYTILTDDNQITIKSISFMSFNEYSNWFKEINNRVLRK